MCALPGAARAAPRLKRPRRRCTAIIAADMRTNSRRSMDKVYAPQDIERRIYERWEVARLVRAARPRRAVLHHDPAAERDRDAAHGARVPAHADGRPHAATTACAATTRCGSRAPIMPASPRRWWSSGSSNAAGRSAPTLGRDGLHRARLAMEGTVRRHHQRADAPARRFGRLVARSLHHGSGADRAPSIEAFVRLHAEGLIYRGKRLVNWDPVLLTALSDLEVQAQEEDGQLWHLRYPLADGSGHVVVATTRPGDHAGRHGGGGAIPDDERYRAPGRPQRAAAARRRAPSRSSPTTTSIRPSARAA